MYRHWLRYSGHRASSGKKIRERNKKEAEGLFQQEQALRFSVSGCWDDGSQPVGNPVPRCWDSCSRPLGMRFPAAGNKLLRQRPWSRRGRIRLHQASSCLSRMPVPAMSGQQIRRRLIGISSLTIRVLSAQSPCPHDRKEHLAECSVTIFVEKKRGKVWRCQK